MKCLVFEGTESEVKTILKDLGMVDVKGEREIDVKSDDVDWSSPVQKEVMARMKKKPKKLKESSEIRKKRSFVGGRKHHKWSRYEDDRMNEMIVKGKPYSTIARELGRTRRAIYVRLSILKKENSSNNVSEIKKIGRPVGNLSSVGRRRFARWNDGETEYLVKYYRHLPIEMIAKRLGRPKGAIYARAKHLSIQMHMGVRDGMRGPYVKRVN